MYPLLRQFDRVVVISLPERQDRRKAMTRQGFAFEFFNAIRPPDPGPFASIGFHGSYLSHLEVLSHGGSVLILEDDCDFLPEAKSYVLPPETDVFCGGWIERSQNHVIGAHCMGFSARGAAFASAYLSALVERRVGPDPHAAAEPTFNPAVLPPIDGAYVWFQRAHPELRYEFAQLSRQRPSRSDCTPGRFDSIPALRPLLGIGRRMKELVA